MNRPLLVETDGFDDDYLQHRSFVEQNPQVFRGPNSFKHELAAHREDWALAGVIIERSNSAAGERKRVFVSPSRYWAWWRSRTRGG